MIDKHGEEWLRPAEAAERLRIDKSLIYVWLHRGRPHIRTHRAGRFVVVNMPDVLDAEHAWRHRKGGHRRVVVTPADDHVR